ncbi:hypothetical protein PACTADRAFT_185831 [Pachysolen tannophilus NRRL Y-2460]|uniref:Elongator complex protein 6 n=1 Tax=Pachysolen tannophilus NRRL Y-2460 TaxID=669874 RepID=A0A1E4U1H9_PACTA|nr:hypothetical protein PACTADRAFT_185831 [Pachysolen tannophilus NRRL Y-2460]
MSDAQQQELAIFKDNSIIPDGLLSSKSKTLITYVQGTSPGWLISALVENLLFNTFILAHKPGTQKFSNIKSRSKVLLVSFSQDYKFYDKFFRKINVSNSNHNFKFLDLLTSTMYDDGEGDEILKKIETTIEKEFRNDYSDLNVIIENPEYLLHTTPLTTNMLLIFLNKLHLNYANNLIVISSSDKNLLDFHAQEESSIEFKHTEFLTKFLFRSNLIMNIKPLDTGRANDVTGLLSINKGLVGYQTDEIEIVEKEYLFFVAKEGNVRLFFR